MIKRLIILVFVAIPFCLSAQTELKFATVNMQEIFALMPETIDANKKISDLAKEYEAEQQNIKNEFEKKYSAYVESRENMSDNIRVRREQELQLISKSIEDFMKVAQNDIKEQQQSLLEPIKKKLLETVQLVGAEGGYAFVIDERNMLYKGCAFEDITPMVKLKLGIE